MKLVLLDYDGTFTDIRDGARAFDATYLSRLSEFLGLKDLRQEWQRGKQALQQSSPETAWMIGGHATAPVACDPYALASEVGERVLAQRTNLQSKIRSEVLGEIFTLSYGSCQADFRPDARVVLGVLRNEATTYFVTNSSTKVVTEHITKQLFPDGLGKLSVQGDARKFAICGTQPADKQFDSLPDQRQVTGLKRPILIKRGAYFDTLKRLCSAVNARPDEVLVCGDVWELDLALPAELGMNVHMILRDNTYQYELDCIKALGSRGGFSAELMPILERI